MSHEEIGERILPGHKRRKTMVSHDKDDRGTVVSFKKTNYLSKSKALHKAKEGSRKKDYQGKADRYSKNQYKDWPRGI